jgi:phenylalanyl-tRNA synthetase alpha chain
MSTVERIGALRAEAERAIAGAPDSGLLEELRVRYLGRKAELPQLLRGVAGLDPSERAAVGRQANEARRALEGLIEEREAALRAGELERQLST